MLKACRNQMKASATYAETTEVATKNQGRDIGKEWMGDYVATK